MPIKPSDKINIEVANPARKIAIYEKEGILNIEKYKVLYFKYSKFLLSAIVLMVSSLGSKN